MLWIDPSRLGLAVALALASAASCKTNDHAPMSDSGLGGGGGGGDFNPSDGDTDGDGSVDDDGGGDDGGAGECLAHEVRQPETDLCWLRCPIGQSWNADGQLCSGVVSTLDRNDAVAACALLDDGSTLAGRGEMIELLGNCSPQVVEDGVEGLCDSCGASATCSEMFWLDVQTYWTRTDGSLSAWAVSFETGSVFMPGNELQLYSARCVRPLP